jgi:leucyl-tRNA synthetase
MKLNNPMINPVSVEKMKLKMIGRTFLSRGGNGQITIPQKKLLEALSLPESNLEYVIPTKEVASMFQSVPPCYKVDIAIPEMKLAIEVDGRSHKTKKWRFLDKRKTEILNALGWRVLRFWNEEILMDIEQVKMTISTYTT